MLSIDFSDNYISDREIEDAISKILKETFNYQEKEEDLEEFILNLSEEGYKIFESKISGETFGYIFEDKDTPEDFVDRLKNASEYYNNDQTNIVEETVQEIKNFISDMSGSFGEMDGKEEEPSSVFFKVKYEYGYYGDSLDIKLEAIEIDELIESKIEDINSDNDGDINSFFDENGNYINKEIDFDFIEGHLNNNELDIDDIVFYIKSNKGIKESTEEDNEETEVETDEAEFDEIEFKFNEIEERIESCLEDIFDDETILRHLAVLNIQKEWNVIVDDNNTVDISKFQKEFEKNVKLEFPYFFNDKYKYLSEASLETEINNLFFNDNNNNKKEYDLKIGFKDGIVENIIIVNKDNGLTENIDDKYILEKINKGSTNEICNLIRTFKNIHKNNIDNSVVYEYNSAKIIDFINTKKMLPTDFADLKSKDLKEKIYKQYFNNIKIGEIILDNYIDISIFSILNKDIKTFEFLIENNAEIDIGKFLNCATGIEDTSIIDYILNLQSKYSKKIFFNNGSSPYYIALENKNMKIFEYLLEKKIEIKNNIPKETVIDFFKTADKKLQLEFLSLLKKENIKLDTISYNYSLIKDSTNENKNILFYSNIESLKYVVENDLYTNFNETAGSLYDNLLFSSIQELNFDKINYLLDNKKIEKTICFQVQGQKSKNSANYRNIYFYDSFLSAFTEKALPNIDNHKKEFVEILKKYKENSLGKEFIYNKTNDSRIISPFVEIINYCDLKYYGDKTLTLESKTEKINKAIELLGIFHSVYGSSIFNEPLNDNVASNFTLIRHISIHYKIDSPINQNLVGTVCKFSDMDYSLLENCNIEMLDFITKEYQKKNVDIFEPLKNNSKENFESIKYIFIKNMKIYSFLLDKLEFINYSYVDDYGITKSFFKEVFLDMFGNTTYFKGMQPIYQEVFNKIIKYNPLTVDNLKDYLELPFELFEMVFNETPLSYEALQTIDINSIYTSDKMKRMSTNTENKIIFLSRAGISPEGMQNHGSYDLATKWYTRGKLERMLKEYGVDDDYVNMFSNGLDVDTVNANLEMIISNIIRESNSINYDEEL